MWALSILLIGLALIFLDVSKGKKGFVYFGVILVIGTSWIRDAYMLFGLVPLGWFCYRYYFISVLCVSWHVSRVLKAHLRFLIVTLSNCTGILDPKLQYICSEVRATSLVLSRWRFIASPARFASSNDKRNGHCCFPIFDK